MKWSAVYGPFAVFLATQAARWGADQRGAATEAELQEARDKELEACSAWLVLNGYGEAASRLRAARRSKPPTLKEQALADLDTIQTHDPYGYQIVDLSNIRRAIEALPND
jgi:hypothetical protein